MTRAIVCGSRDYTDRARAFQILDAAVDRLGLSFVIEGGADGADALAKAWREDRGVDGRTFKADWTGERRAAGPIRNKRMLDEGAPDLVIAFPPGPAGTYNMVKQAEERGIRVIRVDWPTPPPDPASRSDGSPSR